MSTILERYALSTIKEWRLRVNANHELAKLKLSDDDRTGHLSTLLKELVQRLRTPHVVEGKAKVSLAAIAHGRMRSQQGYTAAMLVEESRILQVCIFNTLRTHTHLCEECRSSFMCEGKESAETCSLARICPRCAVDRRE